MTDLEIVQTVSTRLIRPSLPEIRILDVLKFKNDTSGSLPAIFDEECAQYLLANDALSHTQFYSAILRGQPTLRCRLISEEPKNLIESQSPGLENTLTIVGNESLSEEERKQLDKFVELLSRKGYRFKYENK
ncbi:hypothetical protein Ddc_02190 [Ditylenchus destructor]|nr:hypothetical protein Ddc_02190 [Ditylenchus destructor]